MKCFFLLITVLAFFSKAFADVTDYINVKPICEKLENNTAHDVLKEQSTCSLSTVNNEYDINHKHALTMIRHDEKSGKDEEIQVHMNESDLVKLCEEFKSDLYAGSDEKGIEVDIPNPNEKSDRKWRLVITFGPFLSFHRPMKLHLKNEEVDVTLDNLQPIQRHGMHHYKVWSDETKIGKFIDEPQNDITIELVNDKMYFGLRYSHPKTLFQDEHDNPHMNESVSIHGNVGGYEVNEDEGNLDRYFHTLSTSHGNTNINVFGGKRFILLGDKDGNNLELQLGAGAGVSFANGVSKYFYKNEQGQRKLAVTENQGMKIYGFNVTGESSLRYNFMKGKMNASLKARGVYTRFDGPMGDLHATGNLYSGQYGVSIGYSPLTLKSKKEREKKKLERMEIENEKNKEKTLEQLQAESELKP